MEDKVARVDELADDELREVEVGGKKVLLLRSDGVVRAFGARCPHYDAPLAQGLLHDGRLVCPWHGGAFDARTGDLLEPPPLSGLAPLAVRIDDDGDVVVDRPDDAPRQRTMPMADRDPGDERTFVVVGGGAAGGAAVEALRQHGFAGRVVLISREDRRPYDRPNLSKDYLAGTAGADWLPLRPASFYERHAIELRHAAVTRLDVASRRLELDDGTELTPDALLIATGGLPRRLEAPGAELGGVFTLRSWSDCDAIIAALDGAASTVVVGASFIAMETAAALRERGLRVTVVAPDPVPLAAQLGPEVGAFLQARHEHHGVRFCLGHTVARFDGDDRVRAVELDDGSRLDADLVVAGVGVAPATGFVANAEINEDGSLDVDDELRVNHHGVWAAGDVARYPEPHVGGRARVEHWRLAEQHGRAAAASMAGHGAPFGAVPGFWTQQFGLRVAYVGVGRGWDATIVAGDLAGGDFTIVYTRGDELVAAAGTRDLDLAAFSELMRRGRLPRRGKLRGGLDSGLVRLL
jgi:NADPH-dependent 2,4-dienoyl-CoA reductase/sulfur reductase-like enzyme/nitrite reductase/ring-hydroxylating ferredoxin subunit